jgi:hypothetical protein
MCQPDRGHRLSGAALMLWRLQMMMMMATMISMMVQA